MESKEKAKEKRVVCFFPPRIKGSVAMASKEETWKTLQEKVKKLEKFEESMDKTRSRLERNRRLAKKLKEGRRDAKAKMKEKANMPKQRRRKRSEYEGTPKQRRRKNKCRNMSLQRLAEDERTTILGLGRV